jgi:DNA-binding response OmpR family regulator
MLNAVPSHLGPAISVLNVSPIETHHGSLKSIIRHTNWALHRAPCLSSAAGILRDVPVSVILGDCDLKPGKWTDLLKESATFPVPPPLIVTTRPADSVLWREVLSLGGYDLLRKPFAPREVMHVVSLAWWHWHRKCGFPSEAPARIATSSPLPRFAGVGAA